MVIYSDAMLIKYFEAQEANLRITRESDVLSDTERVAVASELRVYENLLKKLRSGDMLD